MVAVEVDQLMHIYTGIGLWPEPGRQDVPLRPVLVPPEDAADGLVLTAW